MSSSDPSGNPVSFVALPDAEARLVLDEALGRLSPLQRQVAGLYLSGASRPEAISQQLDLPLDTVGASLAYAMARLRMMLSDSPLDKQRNDWLLRCRQLLARPTPALAETPATQDHDEVSPQSRDDSADPSARKTPESPASVSADGVRRWQFLALASMLLVLLMGSVCLLGRGERQSSSPEEAEVADGLQAGFSAALADMEEAPLTAPDFPLVLLQEQHDGLLEDLDFFVWLSEQESL